MNYNPAYELYLGEIKPKKRKARTKIEWSPSMLYYLRVNFPSSFNKDIAKHLGISLRSVIRKARELGVEKEAGFLDTHRSIISEMATKALPPQPTKGLKGWCVPNSEGTRFKPGHTPTMKNNPELASRVHKKRNETILYERIRIKIGLPQKTKLKLKVS